MDPAGKIHDQGFSWSTRPTRTARSSGAARIARPSRATGTARTRSSGTAGAACGRMPFLLGVAMAAFEGEGEVAAFTEGAVDGIVTGDVAEEAGETALSVWRNGHFIFHDFSGDLGERDFICSFQ